MQHVECIGWPYVLDNVPQLIHVPLPAASIRRTSKPYQMRSKKSKNFKMQQKKKERRRKIEIEVFVIIPHLPHRFSLSRPDIVSVVIVVSAVRLFPFQCQ